jgi:hypothetical protein
MPRSAPSPSPMPMPMVAMPAHRPPRHRMLRSKCEQETARPIKHICIEQLTKTDGIRRGSRHFGRHHFGQRDHRSCMASFGVIWGRRHRDRRPPRGPDQRKPLPTSAIQPKPFPLATLPTKRRMAPDRHGGRRMATSRGRGDGWQIGGCRETRCRSRSQSVSDRSARWQRRQRAPCDCPTARQQMRNRRLHQFRRNNAPTDRWQPRRFCVAALLRQRRRGSSRRTGHSRQGRLLSAIPQWLDCVLSPAVCRTRIASPLYPPPIRCLSAADR